MEDYKFCILAGGIGSRMSNFTKYFNKAMLPLHGKPVINHIIDKFPEETEIVISTGYLADPLREFITTSFPERKLSFVADRTTESGKGPGYGLLQCKDFLQCPFVLSAADTLVLEPVPPPNVNWFGLAKVIDTKRFCSARVSQGMITRIDDKVKTDNEYAIIGLAGVKDFDTFWRSLESNQDLIGGEIQISNGLESLIRKGLHAKIFTWFDVGTQSSYTQALKNFPSGSSYQGE